MASLLSYCSASAMVSTQVATTKLSNSQRIFPRMRMRVRKWAGEGKEACVKAWLVVPFPAHFRTRIRAYAHTRKNTAGSRNYVRASSPAEALATFQTYGGFDRFLRLGVAPRRDLIATCTIRAQIRPCARLHCTRQLYHGVACGLLLLLLLLFIIIIIISFAVQNNRI